METTSDATNPISKATKSIEEICGQYDKIISKLKSTADEDDEEERWLLKESTTEIAAHLEKQVVPEAKKMVEFIRVLATRVQMLIEKCERVFPQLDEMQRLKSIQTDLGVISASTPRAQSANCPVCTQFPNLRLQASSSGQNGNVFLYVADKLAGSDRGPPSIPAIPPLPLPHPADMSEESAPSVIDNGPPVAKMSPDEIIGGKAPELEERSDDTISIRTITIRSDEASVEEDAKRMDLLWTDSDGDMTYAGTQRRTGKRRRGRRRRRMYSTRSPKRPATSDGASPPDSPRCITCELKIDSSPPTPGAPAIDPNKSPSSPATTSCPLALPPAEKSDQKSDKPVDFIGPSAAKDTSSQRSDASIQVRTAGTNVANSVCLKIFVFVVAYLSTLLIAALALPASAWPGSWFWPLYCRVRNHYCRQGYGFACSGYCASPLELSLWRSK